LEFGTGQLQQLEPRSAFLIRRK